MSKRLPDDELAEIERFAQPGRVTALRDACQQKHLGTPQSKLAAIRRAAEFSFPTADIDQMTKEIGQGYRV